MSKLPDNFSFKLTQKQYESNSKYISLTAKQLSVILEQINGSTVKKCDKCKNFYLFEDGDEDTFKHCDDCCDNICESCSKCEFTDWEREKALDSLDENGEPTLNIDEDFCNKCVTKS